MNLRKASLVAVLGAGLSGAGAVFLAFAPDLLVNFLSQDKEREQKETAQRQNELLEQNAQLLADLAKTVQGQAGTMTAPAATGNPADTPPLATEPAAPAEAQVAAAARPEPEPVPDLQAAPEPVTDQASPAATPAPASEPAPELSTARPRTAPAEPETVAAEASPQARIASFGVFPGEAFSLCGHANFTAAVITTDASAQIALKSPDRSIPGAGFRGFEARLKAREPTILWEDCTIAVDYSTTGGVSRIAISTTTGR